MNDGTRTSLARHLSAIERERLFRYDKIASRMWYTSVGLLYSSGLVSCVALLMEIVEGDGAMAAVYLGMAVALFGAGEKARRAAARVQRRLLRVAQAATSV
ncbi:hypothetical protein [Streptomyces sp. AGS-58]|uniref:hypothetical protein n=1 Tax=unclassified Streptomyces TaxID=2593676 RepID=UPI0035A35D5C